MKKKITLFMGLSGKPKETPLSEKVIYPKEIMPNYQIPLYAKEDLKQALKRLKEPCGKKLVINFEGVKKPVRPEHKIIRSRCGLGNIFCMECQLTHDKIDKIFGEELC